MNSMPRDIAFFSGVDIDKVMRKEPTADSITPSNPQGLYLGYGIPFGKCLTIEDIMTVTEGKLSKNEKKDNIFGKGEHKSQKILDQATNIKVAL